MTLDQLHPIAILALIVWAEFRVMPMLREIVQHERAQSAAMKLTVEQAPDPTTGGIVQSIGSIAEAARAAGIVVPGSKETKAP